MDMRRAITISQRLLEVPGLISGSLDFGLAQDQTNREAVGRFSVPAADIVFEDEDCKLVVVGDKRGEIGLIGKRTERLYYYVRFETGVAPIVGGTVTQVELWRSDAAPTIMPNVTERVFFEVLIPRFKAVMSDTLQTNDGRRFWIRVLGMAAKKGLSVRFLDERTNEVDTFDQSKEALEQWLADRDPWGRDDAHEDKRLIISA